MTSLYHQGKGQMSRSERKGRPTSSLGIRYSVPNLSFCLQITVLEITYCHCDNCDRFYHALLQNYKRSHALNMCWICSILISRYDLLQSKGRLFTLDSCHQLQNPCRHQYSATYISWVTTGNADLLIFYIDFRT
jgi:hypothetical protein